MTIQTKLLLLSLGVLGGAFLLAFFRVLGAWAHHHVSRHDLIAESTRRRVDYRRALAQRNQDLTEGENATVVIEDEAVAA